MRRRKTSHTVAHILRFLLVVSLCFIITSSSSKMNIVISPQKTVDAIISLTRDNIVAPEHIRTEDTIRTGEEFDVNQYFTILDRLSMEPGYVLDYVWGGAPSLYARQKGEKQLGFFEYQDRTREKPWNPAKSLDEAINHIQVDGTADGYFQLVVLDMMGDQFYLFWHAHYNDDTIVCNVRGLEKTLAAADEFMSTFTNGMLLSAPQMPSDLQEEAQALDLEPKVEFSDDVVKVRIVIFTKWGGFYERIYHISRNFPHTILFVEKYSLLRYDCGVIF